MSRKIRTFVFPLILSLVLASAACTDLTSPRSQDAPAPSFTQGQGGGE